MLPVCLPVSLNASGSCHCRHLVMESMLHAVTGLDLIPNAVLLTCLYVKINQLSLFSLKNNNKQKTQDTEGHKRAAM